MDKEYISFKDPQGSIKDINKDLKFSHRKNNFFYATLIHAIQLRALNETWSLKYLTLPSFRLCKRNFINSSNVLKSNTLKFRN